MPRTPYLLSLLLLLCSGCSSLQLGSRMGLARILYDADEVALNRGVADELLMVVGGRDPNEILERVARLVPLHQVAGLDVVVYEASKGDGRSGEGVFELRRAGHGGMGITSWNGRTEISDYVSEEPREDLGARQGYVSSFVGGLDEEGALSDLRVKDASSVGERSWHQYVQRMTGERWAPLLPMPTGTPVLWTEHRYQLEDGREAVIVIEIATEPVPAPKPQPRVTN